MFRLLLSRNRFQHSDEVHINTAIPVANIRRYIDGSLCNPYSEELETMELRTNHHQTTKTKHNETRERISKFLPYRD